MLNLSAPRSLLAIAGFLCLLIGGCKMTNNAKEILPRNQSLPLFRPHMTTFRCEVEADKVPPIDAQADDWFREARTLESPDRFDEPDYKKIVQLTKLAAERHHWKAMLNLASFYLKGLDPPHGVEDAVQLVERAMQLGIPAAYDRMGTYFMNGTGVKADATRAYAFWQKAAEMGNPQAMAFLGEKMSAGEDGALPGYWGNMPVATTILECAHGQGDGGAAYTLHFLYEVPRSSDGTVIGERTRETKERALRVLHEGAKFGCEDCANALSLEFSSPSDLSDMLVPYVDKARGERYELIADALGFDPNARFPNLDKVVPLPPADLPPWDGKRDSLLAAAMGVTLKPVTPAPTDASKSTGRAYLNAMYRLRKTTQTTVSEYAPVRGYWRPTVPDGSDAMRKRLEPIAPGLYKQGEAFDRFRIPDREGHGDISGVVWEYWLTVPHDLGVVDPKAVIGLTKEVLRGAAISVDAQASHCPANGVWQPWVHYEHPMHAIVNQYWRQVWLKKGEAFPVPEQDWLVPVPAEDITWFLIDGLGTQLG
jgi:hypothetical protein